VYDGRLEIEMNWH